MSLLEGKVVSYCELDSEDSPKITGLSTVPSYFNGCSLDLIGAIMHTVHGILEMYPVSTADMESSFGDIRRMDGEDLFRRYFYESAKHQNVQIH